MKRSILVLLLCFGCVSAMDEIPVGENSSVPGEDTITQTDKSNFKGHKKGFRKHKHHWNGKKKYRRHLSEHGKFKRNFEGRQYSDEDFGEHRKNPDAFHGPHKEKYGAERHGHDAPLAECEKCRKAREKIQTQPVLEE